MLKKEYSFDEFKNISFLGWKEKIECDLKDNTLDSLDWSIGHGIRISPFHHKDSLSGFHLKNENVFLNSKPCLNLAYLPNVNERLLGELRNGADGIVLNTSKGFDFDRTLAGIHPQMCHLSFCTDQLDEFHIQYKSWLKANKIELNKIAGYLFQEHLGDETDLLYLLNQYSRLIENENRISGLRSIVLSFGSNEINGSISVDQELAILCSQLVYHIEGLMERACGLSDILESIFFEVVVGDSFFIEIGKIRALKYLTFVILQEYGIKPSEASIPIHTRVLPKIGMEMISSCSQVMSAVLGGADSVCPTIDSLNSSQGRVSRNIINVLKEEAHFDKTLNPIQGSYFMEGMTEQLIKSSWSIFLKIQGQGGFSSIAGHSGIPK